MGQIYKGDGICCPDAVSSSFAYQIRLHDLFVFFADFADIDAPRHVSRLKYVYTRETLFKYAKQIGLPCKSTTKIQSLADLIVDRHRWLADLASCDRRLQAIRRLQARVRSKRLQLNGPYPTVAAVNDSDPFTLEELVHCETADVFSYADSKGNVYAFLANEMQRFVEKTGAWNPYTREAIDAVDILRLRKLIHSKPATKTQAKPAKSDAGWRTVRDAFCDVCIEMDLYGFYTSIDWFTKLSLDDIFAISHALEHNRHISLSLFDPSDMYVMLFEVPLLDWDSIKMKFAEKIIKIIKSNHAMTMYALCHMLLTIQMVNPAVQLPHWIRLAAMQ